MGEEHPRRARSNPVLPLQSCRAFRARRLRQSVLPQARDNIPKDKKSVAINVTLQAIDKTLSEKDLEEISKKIIDIVSKKTGATIRS